MSIDLRTVREAVGETRESLNAAGYDLACEESGDRLVLTVLPREEACEDCLVPKQVMASIVDGELREKGLVVAGVDIVYPGDR